MLSKHLVRRLVALTATCASLALVTSGTVSAYPIGPEGEPLHLETGVMPQLPATGSGTSGAADSGADPSIPANAVPVREISSSGTDWTGIGLTAIASLAVLALATAAVTLTGRRRESARTH